MNRRCKATIDGKEGDTYLGTVSSVSTDGTAIETLRGYRARTLLRRPEWPVAEQLAARGAVSAPAVVTDHIDRFTKDGILTKSGELLEADIIITATGFNLSVMGDIAFDVDGEPVDFADTFTYRGIMNSGIPNMSFMFGYLRTSWTMRVDLLCDFVCKLINNMDERGICLLRCS